MSRAKRKGSNFEREVAKILTDELGIEATRVLLSGIKGEGDISGLPCHIECKRCEQLRLNTWFDYELPKAGTKPFVLIHKQNRREAYATMTLKHWMWLFREAL